MRDDGPSTDPDLSVPLRSLISAWERHLLLASCDDMKFPTWDPGTGTKVFFHIIKARKHRHVTLIMWKGVAPRGKPFGPEPPLQGSHAQQSKSCLLDAAAIRPNSLWNCLQWVTGLAYTFYSWQDGLYTYRWQVRLHRRWVPCHAKKSFVLCSGESTLFLAFSHNPNSFMWARTTSRSRTANWCYWARINQSSM